MTPFTPGVLVRVRERDWVVLPSDDEELLIIKPLGGSDEETAGIYLPLQLAHDEPVLSRFPHPSVADLGDFSTARLLYDAARLAFRNGAGPFRSLAKLSFRPRSYQMVPLIMALRQPLVRLLVSDDVGVGKTIESLLIIKEMLERRRIRRFAVVCLPHLCEQWQEEIRDKLDLDAVIIRSNTEARLDREIQGDISVYDHYPFQVLSIDYIKTEARRNVFIAQCPELVVVDEAHACARPAGASNHQQLRFHLLHSLAHMANQHLVLLTATPHSGKPEEFHSLLGLLRPEFETLEIPHSTQAQRRELARHFVQRKRADVEKWLGEDTPFPKRDPKEFGYDLSTKYAVFFDRVLTFGRKLIAGGDPRRRGHYWAALGLLRGVMSSPAAGIEMLRSRLENVSPDENSDSALAVSAEENPVYDAELGSFESDFTPIGVFEKEDWSAYQRQQLRDLASELEALTGPTEDRKLSAAREVVEDLLKQRFNVVVFCRYIATAKYVGAQLRGLLGGKFPKLDLQVITSEDPDEIRKQRAEDMGRAPQRVLVATDCLSEGINLQHHFTSVVHYDLPWNPNRLEQREGRVDRFGQTAKVVKACLLYGQDNPIDGVVLDVILRKVREIRRSIGITVPFPEDSKSVIDTIAHALLLNPDRRISVRRRDDQVEFSFEEFDGIKQIELSVSEKLKEAEEREKTSRHIFAQNAIKAHEIETDLRDVDQAIGNPQAVESFVTSTLGQIFGVQMTRTREGYKLFATNLPDSLKAALPSLSETLLVSFDSPTPEGHLYLGRNHPFVEQLCQLLMANSIGHLDKGAARAAVIRCREVQIKTTLLLLRVRNVIEEKRSGHKVVAEEMLVWGWRGAAMERNFLTDEEAKTLLVAARPSAEVSVYARPDMLENELRQLPGLRDDMDALAAARCGRLVEAHERFSQLMDQRQFQVVYPVLPMDVLGLYVLLPDLR